MHSTHPDAIAQMIGSMKAPNLCGQVKFYQKKNCVLICVTVSGLPENESGFYGLHIHEGCSCAGSDFPGTGGHYNPEGANHPEHAGDLPPLLCCNGGACMTVATDRFSLKDVLGRTIVIHSMADDFRSQPAGNAGKKIGCGVICRI